MQITWRGYSTQVFAKGDTLRILKGEDHLKEHFSGRGYRAFCPNCGSRLMNDAEDKSLSPGVAHSSIDSDFDARPIVQILVGSNVVGYPRLRWRTLGNPVGLDTSYEVLTRWPKAFPRLPIVGFVFASAQYPPADPVNPCRRGNKTRKHHDARP